MSYLLCFLMLVLACYYPLAAMGIDALSETDQENVYFLLKHVKSGTAQPLRDSLATKYQAYKGGLAELCGAEMTKSKDLVDVSSLIATTGNDFAKQGSRLMKSASAHDVTVARQRIDRFRSLVKRIEKARDELVILVGLDAMKELDQLLGITWEEKGRPLIKDNKGAPKGTDGVS